jgi:hypothetical protein
MNPPDAQLMSRVDLCKMVVTVVSHSDDLSVVWCGVVLCVCNCLVNLAGKFLMFCPISRVCPLAVVSTTHPGHHGV